MLEHSLRGHSRKRKLSYNEIDKCHPSIRKKALSTQSCLPTSIYKNLVKHNKTCKKSDEHCLLDKANLPSAKKETLRTTYLRPKYPSTWEKDPDNWLDNYNIMNVMKQYQEATPWFRFVGVYPIDFSVQNPYHTDKPVCLHPELCDLNLEVEYKKGVRALGFIFNLDPHYKGGSHWVGLYCDIHDLYAKPGSKKHTWCAYFDSYGYDTPAYIKQYMQFLYSQDKRMKLMYNARRFQYSNSECGVYSMYFIICMLNNIRFKDFCKDSVPDKSMLKLRHLFFRK